MSNPVRYDPRLVAGLALELSERLAGQAAQSLRLDAESHRAALDLERETLLLDLHPARGWMSLVPAPPAASRVVRLRRTRLTSIEAPADERILRLAFGGSARSRLRLVVVELMTNQENVLALDADGRILTLLLRRAGGARPLEPGALYEPPAPTRRRGVAAPLAADEWRGLLEGVARERRRAALLRSVAWTSALNADAILAGEDAAETYDRYLSVAWPERLAPCLLEPGRGGQPYPVPLPGKRAEPVPTLLDAMAARAEAQREASGPESGVRDAAAEVPGGRATAAPELVHRLERRLQAAAGRVRRLEEQAAGARPEAETLRRQADLLLAHLGLVRKGLEEVELPDFEGGTVRIALDPALAPSENARRLYDAARKRERAADRIPTLIAGAERERAGLAALLARAERGEAREAEIRSAIGEPTPRRGGRPEETRLPYRRYATSGGLEVRVGRDRRANDDLTFHHSSPNDIWLHARDSAGAHVVLRWSDAQANPPRRDLEEAAVLAALHSRARTSGTVPVDWTRRKHVRKPRKAPAGRVAMERARTVFVEPDAALEARLRKE